MQLAALGLVVLLADVLSPTAAVVDVNNPGNDYERVLAHSFQQVPECWRSASPLQLRYDPNRNENMRYYLPSRAELDAGVLPAIVATGLNFPDHPDHEFEVRVLTIKSGAEEDTERRVRNWLVAPASSIMLHESSHHFHLGSQNKSAVEDFLKIRFRDLYKTMMNGTYGDLRAQYFRQVRQRPVDVPAIIQTRREINRVLADNRVIQTGTKGDHALDNASGAEYFAMMIEALVYDHGAFCGNASADEIRYLREHFGECLAQMPALAPCYKQQAESVSTGSIAKEGMRRE